MKLHSELTAGTILGRQPRAHDDRTVDRVLASLAIPVRLSNFITTQRAVGAAIRLPELVVGYVPHCVNARPRGTGTGSADGLQPGGGGDSRAGEVAVTKSRFDIVAPQIIDGLF